MPGNNHSVAFRRNHPILQQRGLIGMTTDFIAAGLVILALSSRVAADCGLPPPTCDALAKASLVFYGEVLESTFHPNYVGANEASTDGRQEVRFNVLRGFRGAQVGLFTGTFGITSEAVSFRKGHRYLVYASQRQGRWVTSCSRTREILNPTESVVPAELTELGSCTRLVR